MADARILPCLEELIGVADTDCECFTEGQSGDVIPPRSGLYVSNLVNLEAIQASGICSSEDLYTLCLKSIEEASIRWQNNLLACWGARNTAREKWTGVIGQQDAPKSFAVGDALAGLMFHPDESIIDGELVITGVGTMFNTTGTDLITVSIYDQVSDTPLHTFNLDATANKFEPNSLATPIILPFRLSNLMPAKYWMLYEVPDGVRPMDGEIDCGCSSGMKRLYNWLSIFGTQGDLLTERQDWNKLDRHYGLLPEITARCKVENSICPDEELDFATNANAGLMAEGIQFLAASITLGKVLRSARINKITLQPDDFKKEERSNYNKEFTLRVDQVCKSMNPGSCYTCDSNSSWETVGA